MTIQLRGATAVVTGASRGLGRAIAMALAERGASVALAARSSEDLELVRKEIEVAGGTAMVVVADVSSAEHRERLVAAVEGELGPIDVLVNNAGIERFGTFVRYSEEEIRRLLTVDLESPMLLTHRVLPGMLERRRGHVVNLSSILAKCVGPWNTVYAGAKYGVLGWSLSLRLELRGTGVSVSAVCPGFVLDEGMYANQATAADARLARLAGMQTTSAKVARAVVKAIERDLPEVVPAGPIGGIADVMFAVSGRLGQAIAVRSPATAMGRRMAERQMSAR